jgi:hypothetical protein
MERDDIDKLAERVQCQLAGRVHDLRLLFRNNGLVLQGQCHSHHAKQLAQHYVLEGTGIPLLANDTKVL